MQIASEVQVRSSNDQRPLRECRRHQLRDREVHTTMPHILMLFSLQYQPDTVSELNPLEAALHAPWFRELAPWPSISDAQISPNAALTPELALLHVVNTSQSLNAAAVMTTYL
jgi:hypothetical protein